MRQAQWLRQQKREFGIHAELLHQLAELSRRMVADEVPYERVVELLRAMVLEEGLKKFTQAEVVRRLGFSRATVYRHRKLKVSDG